MTEDRLALFELIDQSANKDLVRDMLDFAAARMMKMEVAAHTGAAEGPSFPMMPEQFVAGEANPTEVLERAN